MRIGVLTGGGDCPGLNAVIRAVVRKGVTVHGHEFVGFRDGWRGPLEGDTMQLGVARPCAASCRAAARSSARRGPTRIKIDGGVERIKENLARARGRRADRDRRRGHPRRRQAAHRRRREGRRRAQDDRQRPRRDRLHLRLRHRRQDRHRGDRPAAHHGRVPPPRADRRGHGPPRGLDRPARRAWPAAPTPSSSRSSRSTSTRSAPTSSPGSRPATRRSSWSPRARSPMEGRMALQDRRARRLRARAAGRDRRDAGRGDRGADRQRDPRHRARPHPARRHSHGVRPGAGHPVRPARPSTRSTRATAASWSRCRAPTSSGSPLDEATTELKTVPVSATRRPRSSSADRREGALARSCPQASRERPVPSSGQRAAGGPRLLSGAARASTERSAWRKLVHHRPVEPDGEGRLGVPEGRIGW